MEKRTSDTLGGQFNMNLRYWGGWFLVVAALGLILTMGCEKGALGVKPSLVMGRIVDQDNPSKFVEGATIRMVSVEDSGSGEMKQSFNFATTISDADGKFIFENVQPDNVMLEIAARSYIKTVFPSSSTESGGGASDEEGAEGAEESGESADYQKVSIKSGSVMDLGNISLKKIANPLPDTVGVSVVLRDAKTLEPLDDSSVVTISFNTQTYRSSVKNWKDGFDSSGKVIRLTAEQTFSVTAKVDTDLYRIFKREDISGASDVNLEILLEPVTYNILLRAVRVPDYIQGGVMNVFAEIPAGESKNPAGVPKIIATHTINDLGDLSEPNLPEIVSIPGLAMPVDLRIQVRGYKDEVVRIKPDILEAGSQGNYRIDVDFLYNNLDVTHVDPQNASFTYFIYNPFEEKKSSAGLFDNIIRRDVSLIVAGPDLKKDNKVTAAISLPHESLEYNPSLYIDKSRAGKSDGSSVEARFRNTAVGYLMNYTVTVTNASGSFNISPDEGVMINPPNTDPARGVVIGVNAVSSGN